MRSLFLKQTILILTAGLFFSGFLPELSAQQISSVQFIQPDSGYKFDDDVLKFNISSKTGTLFNERTLNDDIKRLHGMGMFSDIATETRKEKDGRIAVIFKIMPQPVVEDIIFRGNKAYDTKALSEKLTLSRSLPLNAPALQQSANAIRDFYKSKGLNDAKVTVRTERAGSNKVNVVFEIQEHLRYRVGDVSFKGAKVISESDLKDTVMTRKSFLSHPWFSWFSQYGLFDKEVLSRDRILLRDAYKKLGYLDFKIKDIKVSEDPKDPSIINVLFEIEEGQPYKVGKVSINGAKHFKADELIKMIGMKPGITYSSNTERSDIKNIENKYYRLGYADFNIKPRLFPNYLTHTVDIDYDITEGPQYKIHTIFISGNRYTKDHVIRRELPMAPGDPVDNNLVKMTKSRLMGMGFFQKVEAAAIRSEEGELDTKDIDIRVKEKKFIDAKIGGSWSDSNSLAGMLEITHTNMDILDPWNYFTGGGQRMRLAGVIGLDRYGFEVDFTEPWLFGIPLKLDISGYLRNKVYDDWQEERLGFTISLTKRIFDDFTTINGGYTFEQVRIHDMSKHMSYEFRQWDKRELVGRINLGLTRDTRDSITDPRHGYFINLLGALTSQALGGANDYIRLEARGSWHYSFLSDLFVLSLGGKIGTVTTFDSKDVPLYDRYFLGGGDSVRGFPYRSIGPTDYNKDNYGGQSMYIFTAELSHPIYKEYLRGAVFMDLGGVGTSAFEFGSPNIGAGYGVRIKLPSVATPIRLDLAFPVLNKQDGVSNSLRFHFNIGASFSPPL